MKYLSIIYFTFKISLLLFLLITLSSCKQNEPNMNPPIEEDLEIIPEEPILPESVPSSNESNYKLQKGNIAIHFLDVGKADCILIQESSGKNMLIDAGDNLDSNYIYSYLKHCGVRSLDYLILTHPHEDHIGSADMVILNFDVKKVIISPTEHTNDVYGDVLEAINEKDIALENFDLTNNYSLGTASFKLLGPLTTENTNYNNLSIITQLTFGENVFLFTGDAGSESEADLVSKYGTGLASDLLKVGHHGNKTASSETFLNHVAPKYAVISVGKNNEEQTHPSPIIIDRLKQHDINIFNTNEDGTILATSNGQEIIIEKYSTYITNEIPPIKDKNLLFEIVEQGIDSYDR